MFTLNEFMFTLNEFMLTLNEFMLTLIIKKRKNRVKCGAIQRNGRYSIASQIPNTSQTGL